MTYGQHGNNGHRNVAPPRVLTCGSRATATAVILSALVLISCGPAPSGTMAQPEPGGRTSVIEGYGRLPLSFEANQGQTDARHSCRDWPSHPRSL